MNNNYRPRTIEDFQEDIEQERIVALQNAADDERAARALLALRKKGNAIHEITIAIGPQENFNGDLFHALTLRASLNELGQLVVANPRIKKTVEGVTTVSDPHDIRVIDSVREELQKTLGHRIALHDVPAASFVIPAPPRDFEDIKGHEEAKKMPEEQERLQNVIAQVRANQVIPLPNDRADDNLIAALLEMHMTGKVKVSVVAGELNPGECGSAVLCVDAWLLDKQSLVTEGRKITIDESENVTGEVIPGETVLIHTLRSELRSALVQRRKERAVSEQVIEPPRKPLPEISAYVMIWVKRIREREIISIQSNADASIVGKALHFVQIEDPSIATIKVKICGEVLTAKLNDEHQLMVLDPARPNTWMVALNLDEFVVRLLEIKKERFAASIRAGETISLVDGEFRLLKAVLWDSDSGTTARFTLADDKTILFARYDEKDQLLIKKDAPDSPWMSEHDFFKSEEPQKAPAAAAKLHDQKVSITRRMDLSRIQPFQILPDDSPIFDTITDLGQSRQIAKNILSNRGRPKRRLSQSSEAREEIVVALNSGDEKLLLKAKIADNGSKADADLIFLIRDANGNPLWASSLTLREKIMVEVK